jgi:hypothetical protein
MGMRGLPIDTLNVRRGAAGFRECRRSRPGDLIAERLKEAFPNDGFYGGRRRDRFPPASMLWVVDPIDGTANFVRAGAGMVRSITCRGGPRHRRHLPCLKQPAGGAARNSAAGAKPWATSARGRVVGGDGRPRGGASVSAHP